MLPKTISILRVLWESFSIALLLFGSYLIYVYIWFSINKIFKLDIYTYKVVAATIVGTVLLLSFFKRLRKKIKENKEKTSNSVNLETWSVLK